MSKKSLAEFAWEADKKGMTYGQYSAYLYAEKSRKAAEKPKKRRETK